MVDLKLLIDFRLAGELGKDRALVFYSFAIKCETLRIGFDFSVV